MLSLPFSLRPLSRPRESTDTFTALVASRLARAIVASLLFFCALLGLLAYWLPGRGATVVRQPTGAITYAANGSLAAHGQAKYGRLHLLVPSTSSNPDFCKLLVSAQVLGYPTPVLINFGDPEAENAYVQHLAKVEGILEYLDTLPVFDEEQGQDLVLIVDAWDVWFQLHRDVLIQRYYSINEAADTRTKAQYGGELFTLYDMRQTILFGPDKLCWPTDYSRPACWAVPETILPEYAFGPQTGQGRYEHNQPRWLNSGTIMGPVRDLRGFFRATLDEIHANHTTDSDQFYMAEVFGRQEYARLQRKPELLAYYKGIRFGREHGQPEWNITRSQPNMSVERTEYHVGIDYESSMFQTLAFWKQFLTWTRAADVWPPKLSPVDRFPHQGLLLPDDIAHTRQPFRALEAEEIPHDEVVDQSWSDVELLYNVVTKQAPVLIHITAEKRFRQVWWQKLWLQSYAKLLRLPSLKQAAAAARRSGKAAKMTIRGYEWFNAEPLEANDIKLGGLGGAWADSDGGWFSWRGLCGGNFEAEIYNTSRVTGEDFFHPPVKPHIKAEGK